MMGTDFPYLKKLKKNNIIMPFHWTLDDWPHVGWNVYPKFDYQGNLRSQETIFEIWKGEFDAEYALDEDCLFDLTMHPQLTGRARMIMMFDRLNQYIKGFPDAWIATPIELARAAQKALS